MKAPSWGVLSISFLWLMGCSPYHHHSGVFGGYSDVRINYNTSIISYEGRGVNSLEVSQDYLLYRAAQITQTSGFDYFIVASKNLNGIDPETLPYIKLLEKMRNNSDDAFAVIKMYRGDMKIGSPNTYDARQVLNLINPIM